MKENNIFFILHSKVILNTIEYVFIGDEEADIELFSDVSSAMPELVKEPRIVVYEIDKEKGRDDNLHVIRKLRSTLPDYISLIVFGKEETIVGIEDELSSEMKPVKTVLQDNFFLDNLFNTISKEQKGHTVLYQM